MKEIVNNRFKQILFIGIQRIQDPYYHGFAAQIAFFLMLSIMPLFLLLSQLLNVFDISINYAYYLMDNYLPAYISDTLCDWLQKDVTPTKSNILFIVIAVWAASRAQFSIMRITNYTMTSGKTTGNGYFPERLRSLIVLVFTIITIAVSLIVLAYGQTILDIVYQTLHLSNITHRNEIDAWLKLRWVVVLVLYFLVISYNYYVLPAQKSRYRDVIPGSILAAIGIIIVTLLYGLYNHYAISGEFNVLYGSIASFVLMLVWFYLLSWVICLGVLFNKLWMETSIQTVEKEMTQTES